MASTKRISVTFTALVWTGILMAIAGATVSILGIVGGESQFEATIGRLSVKTTHVGLALVVVGSTLASVVALKLPRGVELFGEQERSWPERVAERVALPSFALAIIGTVALLAYSFLH